jgi:hypothetical protein
VTFVVVPSSFLGLEASETGQSRKAGAWSFSRRERRIRRLCLSLLATESKGPKSWSLPSPPSKTSREPIAKRVRRVSRDGIEGSEGLVLTFATFENFARAHPRSGCGEFLAKESKDTKGRSLPSPPSKPSREVSREAGTEGLSRRNRRVRRLGPYLRHLRKLRESPSAKRVRRVSREGREGHEGPVPTFAALEAFARDNRGKRVRGVSCEGREGPVRPWPPWNLPILVLLRRNTPVGDGERKPLRWDATSRARRRWRCTTWGSSPRLERWSCAPPSGHSLIA